MKAKSKPVRTTRSDLPFPEFREPVTRERPCGNDLEYDPDFVVLMAKAAPKADAQYGDFVSAPEAVNWADLERDCRRMLVRTRDIRILVLLLRCRTRLAQATGLRDGLSILAHGLTKWPDAIHPQLTIDDEADPAMRANALAALTDPEGLMQDVREIAITDSAALRLQMRDVERSLGLPRLPDALAPESVRQQLQEMRRQHSTTLAALDEAAALVGAIDEWAKANLPEDRPNLKPLRKLLVMVADSAAPAIQPTTVLSIDETHSEVGESEAAVDSSSTIVFAYRPAEMPQNRDHALANIRAARHWFEAHEPSSPVGLLLRQAEKLTGKRFDEIFQAIPADLVERWAHDEA